MNDKLSKFVKDNHPDAKGDLFSCFIERGNRMAIQDGYNCMVTMQSWMFLSSFEKLRQKLLHSKTIMNLMHMENMVMGIAFGTAVTVFRNCHIDGFKGTYNQIKLKDIDNSAPKKFPVPDNRFAWVNASNFSKIPGSPIVYWVSEKVFLSFSNTKLSEYASPRIGLITGDTDRFLRLWFEVSLKNIYWECPSNDAAKSSDFKWFPYQKGGEFRRWFGNNEFLLNWKNDGWECKNDNFSGSRVKSHNYNGEYAFRAAITWTKISSGTFACRFVPVGFMFDDAGPICTVSEGKIFFILGLLNSKVGAFYLSMVSPTINYLPGHINSIPIQFGTKESQAACTLAVEKLVQLSKQDWDSHETSWDFKRHPLV